MYYSSDVECGRFADIEVIRVIVFAQLQKIHNAFNK